MTGRKRPVINYSEHGMQNSGRDSNYEAKLKPLPPLDNKSYPSVSRIATQLVINENRAARQTKQKTVPDETDPCIRPVQAENSPTKMDAVPDETTSLMTPSLPDETNPLGATESVPIDEIQDKVASPDATDEVENATSNVVTNPVKP